MNSNRRADLVLLAASLLLLLTLGRQTGPLALGLLFLVWVNLHGGFFMPPRIS